MTVSKCLVKDYRRHSMSKRGLEDFYIVWRYHPICRFEIDHSLQWYDGLLEERLGTHQTKVILKQFMKYWWEFHTETAFLKEVISRGKDVKYESWLYGQWNQHRGNGEEVISDMAQVYSFSNKGKCRDWRQRLGERWDWLCLQLAWVILKKWLFRSPIRIHLKRGVGHSAGC